MSVAEFKSQFSKVIEWVKEGNKVAVTFGKKKEVVGYFIPRLPSSMKKRKLGIMEGKADAVFYEDYKISEEEFLQQ